MLYRDVSRVSVFGLRGTLYVEKARTAEGVSVRTEGPYEAKVTDDSCLVIYPEGQEPTALLQAGTDVTAGGTHIGSVGVTARAEFATDAARRRRARAGPGRRVRARVSVRMRATVRITAPPNTRIELIGCRGLRKGPGGWRSMQGNSRFAIR